MTATGEPRWLDEVRRAVFDPLIKAQVRQPAAIDPEGRLLVGPTGSRQS
jgi:hypothetical protein